MNASERPNEPFRSWFASIREGSSCKADNPVIGVAKGVTLAGRDEDLMTAK